MRIRVANLNKDRFGDSIKIVLDILSKVFSIPSEEEIILDLSNCNFSNPLILLSLTIIDLECRRNGRLISFARDPNSSNFERYLNYIYFHEGFKPDSMNIADYNDQMKGYMSRNYIPIINFPATRKESETAIRDKFLSVVTEHLRNKLNLTGQLYSAVSYLIDEAINNIVDHSFAERGFIFTQYYPSKGYMDVTIADNGIGILGSYQKNNFPDVISDSDALNKAMGGFSTKTTAIGRGFGIHTSSNMLVTGLGGNYFLFSGNAFLINTPKNEAIIRLDKSYRISGTILFMRIPMQHNPDFQYINYIES